MKVCPRCQKTYADDNLNFCLEDGSVLTQAGNAPPPDTVLVNHPRTTAPPKSSSSTAGQTGAQGSWGSSPQPYSMQPPKKSSKTWIWVVAILALVVLVCGGGLVGFFAFVSTIDTNENTYRANTSDRTNTGTTSSTPANKKKFDDVEEIDLSNGEQKFSIYGETEFTDGEFFIKCNATYAYYVILTSDKYISDSALTTIAVRNADNSSTERGFGLVFHSDPNAALNQDYAFLIDSKKKRYRVIRHDKQKELLVTKWTNFAGIKDGTEKNVLEVRDDGDDLVLSINGQQVTTIPDTYGYKNGVPGMYTSGAVRAAFSDFEIKK